ncbi:hypothetical protein BDV39DRAFT_177065 [Aspergillus sergii]|uniref:Uncharacterized protein n=1 Tax=Aspergillus sergii TaxID=1034303 RepID=A0A5N6X037_9EURO|nr:hypothetical protein BDV39DRAFT_177065 [Aspergillus sergii]
MRTSSVYAKPEAPSSENCLILVGLDSLLTYYSYVTLGSQSSAANLGHIELDGSMLFLPARGSMLLSSSFHEFLRSKTKSLKF